MTRSIILLEFNELCPALLDRWIAAGLLPNFKRFRDQSQVFTTEPDEPNAPYLEPWIQWYSIHTGLPYTEHKVFHLVDGIYQDHSDIWSDLGAKGASVASMCSMNARRPRSGAAFYVPDPWCGQAEPYPDALQNFHGFVAKQVQEYTRNGHGADPSALRFGTFLATHGLKPSSAYTLARQIAAEKLSKHDIRWRRACLLDLIQMDVFEHYYRKHKPDFATFFLNSTAHLQHAYWRDMEPERFAAENQSRNPTLKNAILHGYQAMDKLLGRFFKIEEETGATLILATALGQEAYVDDESKGGRHYYRPHDIDDLLARLECRPAKVEPVMTHQYRVRFDSPEAADQASATLKRYQLDGAPVLQASHDEPGVLHVGNLVHRSVGADETMTDSKTGETIPFFDLFYRIDAVKSGRHHPDGILWIKTGTPEHHTEKVSILDIKPTIEHMMGYEPSLGANAPGRYIL